MELFYNNDKYMPLFESDIDIADIDWDNVEIDWDKLKKEYGGNSNENKDSNNAGADNTAINDEAIQIKDKVEQTVCPLYGIDYIGESLKLLNMHALNEMTLSDIVNSMINDGTLTNDDLKKLENTPIDSTIGAPDVINIDNDIKIDDARFNTYENDIIYKNGVTYMQEDGSITNNAFEAVKSIAMIHSDILNLYVNMPFEDWNETKIGKFKSLLEKYWAGIETLDNVLDEYKWNNNVYESKFNDLYWNIIRHDYDSYIRICERHEHYITYRSNRIQLLMTLFQVVDRPTLPHNKSAKMVFNYIARQCDGFPLYGNTVNDKANEILTDEIYNHRVQYMHDIITFNTGGKYAYDDKDFHTIVTFYVFCRRMLFDIFNIFTSNNKYNGYQKYKKLYDDFCNGTIKAKQLEALYNSIRSRFGQADDYHNIMDQNTFNQQGIFESWWAEDVKWYHDNCPDRFTKDKISKINMIPTNVNACKVRFDGHTVYSNAKFYVGDIIEVCPARTVGKDSLYSQDMRDIVLEVEPHRKWVIPFGYCQYYRPAGYKKDANCRYEWDSKNGNVIIRALSDIPKDTELVMQIIKLS